MTELVIDNVIEGGNYNFWGMVLGAVMCFLGGFVAVLLLWIRGFKGKL